MLKFISKFFSAPLMPRDFTTLEIKYMNPEITLFYKGQVLTPNTDYSIDYKDNSVSVIKIPGKIKQEELKVMRCYIPFTGRSTSKMVMYPWGYKKFKHHEG